MSSFFNENSLNLFNSVCNNNSLPITTLASTSTNELNNALAFIATSQPQNDLLLKNYSPAQTISNNLETKNTSSWSVNPNIVGNEENDETLKKTNQTDDINKNEKKNVQKQETNLPITKNSLDSE